MCNASCVSQNVEELNVCVTREDNGKCTHLPVGMTVSRHVSALDSELIML